MLKILLRKQLYELNSSFFYDRKKGRVRSKGTSILLIVLYALLMIVIMGGIFTMLSVMLCAPFVGMGLDWLYFDMMTLIALFLGVFGGVFNTYSSLYKARDNDLMLSLPIPTRYVLISRLTGVYLMGLMFSAVVMLPAVIVYFVVAHPAVEGVVGSLLLTVLVSVFVFILSCLLGWVVAKISVHLKSRSLIVVILSLVFFGLYYFVCFNAYELLQELIVNALTVGEKIMDSAHILYIIGDCGRGGLLSMLYLTLAVVILFIITYRILAHSFIRIATTSDRVARREYRAQTAKMRSASSALLHHEFSRLLASPTYMLNCALGTPILIIAGAVLLIKGQDLVALADMLPFPAGFLTVMMAVGICVIGAMNDLTAPSISLEQEPVDSAVAAGKAAGGFACKAQAPHAADRYPGAVLLCLCLHPAAPRPRDRSPVCHFAAGFHAVRRCLRPCRKSQKAEPQLADRGRRRQAEYRHSHHDARRLGHRCCSRCGLLSAVRKARLCRVSGSCDRRAHRFISA